MEYYEHTYIAVPEASKKDIEIIESKIDQILKKNNGKIHKLEDWGLRNLAYPIKKNYKGYYRNIYFEGKPGTIKEIENYEKYEDKIIKFLSFKIKKVPETVSELNKEQK